MSFDYTPAEIKDYLSSYTAFKEAVESWQARFGERAKMLLPKVNEGMGEDERVEVNQFIYPYTRLIVGDDDDKADEISDIMSEY